MKITEEFLYKFNVHSYDIKLIRENNLIGVESPDFIEKLIELDELTMANWFIVRILDKIDCAKYALYAAEQVLPIFKEKYPNDDTPYGAIELIKTHINNIWSISGIVLNIIGDNIINALGRRVYGDDSHDNNSSYHARCVLRSVAYTAYVARDVCNYVIDPDNFEDDVFIFGNAYITAVYANDASDNKILKKILKNGIELLK